MVDRCETRYPILKTILIVEDRINEIMEARFTVERFRKLQVYVELKNNLLKLYTGDI